MDVDTFKRLGLDAPFGIDDFWGESVNGRSNLDIRKSFGVPGDRQYHPCREAYPDESVPKGSHAVIQDWAESSIFPDTRRDIEVYIPHQLDVAGEKPALVIFNDGAMYSNPEGPVRVCKVLDTLHANGEIPCTIAVFATPGHPLGVERDATLIEDNRYWKQREDEYSECTDVFGRFLLQELIPFVEDRIEVSFADDPKKRTVCGYSSGGMCAFNTAWHFPETFGCVLSHCGSFVDLRGAHNYPYLIRSTPRKPIRAYLQSGTNDADIVVGNWPLANQQMAAALRYAGYEIEFTFGEGGHTLHHAGATIADAFRWLWKK